MVMTTSGLLMGLDCSTDSKEQFKPAKELAVSERIFKIRKKLLNSFNSGEVKWRMSLRTYSKTFQIKLEQGKQMTF